MTVRIKNLELEIKGDAKKIEKAMQQAMDTYTHDAFTQYPSLTDRMGQRLFTWHSKPKFESSFVSPQYKPVYEIQKIYKQFREREKEPMKKLYKVFVVNNEGEVFEKNVVSDSGQNAWYNVVREVAPDDKLEDLTVNVLTICPVKNSCC